MGGIGTSGTTRHTETVNLSKVAEFHKEINGNLFNALSPLQIIKITDKKKHANVHDTKGVFMSKHVATALFSPCSLCPLGTLLTLGTFISNSIRGP